MNIGWALAQGRLSLGFGHPKLSLAVKLQSVSTTDTGSLGMFNHRELEVCACLLRQGLLLLDCLASRPWDRLSPPCSKPLH